MSLIPPSGTPAPRKKAALSLPKYSREVSVMAWIEDACGLFLMVRQAQGKRLWSLPGGKAKAGERLDLALRRELMEEIGERVRTAIPVALFDRPKKRNLTILYRVTLQQQRLVTENHEEIEFVGFKLRPPLNSSPSARHFWALREQGRFGFK
jgi:ADP-ribose pyrophosphatase YjhB (NUDIX family)